MRGLKSVKLRSWPCSQQLFVLVQRTLSKGMRWTVFAAVTFMAVTLWLCCLYHWNWQEQLSGGTACAQEFEFPMEMVSVLSYCLHLTFWNVCALSQIPVRRTAWEISGIQCPGLIHIWKKAFWCHGNWALPVPVKRVSDSSRRCALWLQGWNQRYLEISPGNKPIQLQYLGLTNTFALTTFLACYGQVLRLWYESFVSDKSVSRRYC